MRSPHFVLVLSLMTLGASAAHSSSANPENVATFRATKACPGCDLKNAQLGGMQAANAQLANADLTDATFYGSNLRSADLTGAILDRTNLEMVDMTGAIGAVLTNSITDARTTCPNGSAGPCS